MPPSNAIKFVKRDAHTNDGKPEGTLTANPTAIDGVIIRAWQKVFEGDAAGPQRCVDTYVCKHGHSFHWHEEMEAPDIMTDKVL